MNRLKRRFFIQIVIRVIFLVVLVTACYSIFSLFEIKNVIVDPTNIDIKYDSKKFSNNLLLIRVNKLRELILNSYPTILDINFQKQYPSTLKINLKLREPIAQLKTIGGVVCIDENMVLFESSHEVSLPMIDIPITKFELGQKIDEPKISFALAFIDKLRHDEAIKLVRLSSEDTLIFVFSDFEVMLQIGNDLENKAHTLQTILKGFRMKGSVPARIDLRYDKPIIMSAN